MLTINRFEGARSDTPNLHHPGFPLLMRQDIVNESDSRLAGVQNVHEDFYALYIVRQGNGVHEIDGAPYLIQRGDVYVMGPGAVHCYRGCSDLVMEGLYFTPRLLPASSLDDLAEVPGFHGLLVSAPTRRSRAARSGHWLRLGEEECRAALEEIGEMRREYAEARPGALLLVRGLFLRLLIHLSRRYALAHPEEASAAAPAHRHEETAAAAARLMRERFSEPLRIEEVAAAVFLSPDRFTEVFGAVQGVTPRDYLRRLRIEAAERLLAETDWPITRIALDCGFTDAAYFSRAFRAATGLTPRAWRGRTRPAT